MTSQRKQNVQGRRARLWPSLLLLVLTMAVASAVGEVACRIAERMLMGLRWDWRESCIPAAEPALVYSLAPDLEIDVAGVPFRTNGAGFRDRPYPAHFSPAELRVAVVGDSLTAGFGVADGEAFPRLLETTAAGLARPGQGLRVLNLGVPGYNLEQQAALTELCLARYRPRLILLCLFVNDLERPFLALGAEGDLVMPQSGLAASGGFSPRGWLRANSYFYRFLGTRWNRLLRLSGARPDEAQEQRRRYARLWSDTEQRRRLERVLLRTREVVSDAGQHRRLAVVLLPALFQLIDSDPLADPVRVALAETCGRLEIPLIDLLTPLAAEAEPSRLYFPDDPHPAPGGHLRFAELIARGLGREGLLPLPRDNRGGWSEPQRVTRTPGNSHTAALHDRSMAFDGDGLLQLVWFDASDYPEQFAAPAEDPDSEKNGRIYEIYHAVLDGGQWSAPQRLSPRDGRTSRTPDLLADRQGRISLIYSDDRTGTMGIYARPLTASGWGADRRVTPGDLVAYKASFCLDSTDRFHLAFPGQLADRREIFHTRLGSEPLDDPAPVGRTPAGGRCFFPSLVPDAADGSLHLVWKMTPAQGVPGIYHRRLADGEWGPVTRLTPRETAAGQPSTTPAAGGGAHLVWVDSRHGQPEIYYRLLGAGGSADERVTWHHPAPRAYEIRHPSVAQAAGGPLQLVWSDSGLGNFEVFHKNRGENGWSITTRITRDRAVSMDASIYPAPDGTLHVVWDDDRDGNFEIYHATLVP
jgi:lysophospholipase L1-like esterase